MNLSLAVVMKPSQVEINHSRELYRPVAAEGPSNCKKKVIATTNMFFVMIIIITIILLTLTFALTLGWLFLIVVLNINSTMIIQSNNITISHSLLDEYCYYFFIYTNN